MAVPVPLNCWHLGELLLYPTMFCWVSVWGWEGRQGLEGITILVSFCAVKQAPVSHGLESCTRLGEPALRVVNLHLQPQSFNERQEVIME